MDVLKIGNSVTSHPMTLEAFLDYDDGTDGGYELEDGELRQMPTESEINILITSFLFAFFLRSGVSFARLRMKTEVVVSGSRATVRIPDFMVLPDESVSALAGAKRSMVTLDMLPPQLGVEVVSPGKENEDRDYRYKRSQYQARGILEYWIVDPGLEQITVLRLVNGLYEEVVFESENGIVSTLLQELGVGLTVNQVLQIQHP